MNSFNEKKITSPWPVLVVLFILFPPLGLIGIAALLAYNAAKKNAGAAAPSPGRTKLSGQRLADFFTSADTAERPYRSHGHTPHSYSYDACAREKRLEQLKVLKGAGLLDEVEYQQRKQEILKEL